VYTILVRSNLFNDAALTSEFVHCGVSVNKRDFLWGEVEGIREEEIVCFKDTILTFG
jgi:hypothetical protein